MKVIVRMELELTHYDFEVHLPTEINPLLICMLKSHNQQRMIVKSGFLYFSIILYPFL